MGRTEGQAHPFGSRRGDRKRVTADPPRRGRAEQPRESTPRALSQREAGAAGVVQPSSPLFCRSLFSSFRLAQQWDTCSAGGAPADAGGRRDSWPLPPPHPPPSPSAVSEVLARDGLVVALTDAGNCVAYRVGGSGCVCQLNAAGEAVRSIFLNTAGRRQDLILISVHAPHFSALHVRAIALDAIAAGSAHAWCRLLGGTALAWPGFVELDDVGGRCLSYNAADGVYRVWCLESYGPLYSITAGGAVAEARIGPPDLLLLVMQQREGALPLRLLSFQDGALLKEVSVPLHGGPVPQLVELFGAHVLLMQGDGPLRIVDTQHGSVREVALGAPSALVNTPLNRCFLAFYAGGGEGVAAWSADGRKLASLALPTRAHASTVFVTRAETLLLIWDGSGAGAAAEGGGCVHAIDLKSGLKQVARIGGRGCGAGRREQAAALAAVTSIYYDEARQEMYVGTADGQVAVWSA